MKYITCSMSGVKGNFLFYPKGDLLIMADQMADLRCLQAESGEIDGGPVDEIRHTDRIFARRVSA